MRADLPAAVASAIAHAEGPSLIFDLGRLEANATRIAAAARAEGITVLFAAKSFPHPAVRALVAKHFDGFDVASVAELDEVSFARVISVADPTGRTGARSSPPRGSSRLIVSCEAVDQVRAAPAHAEIAIRISSSLTGRDPAVGVVQDGSGHRRSRFGLDIDPERRTAAIRSMVEAANGRPVGIHIHHGPVTATAGERFVATATAALAVVAEAGLAPRFLNLGGAWHGIADLEGAFCELRAAVPDLELIIEPGRALVDEAGFACGRVTVARELDDRALRVVDLSRICHLRWSQVELVGSAPRAGHGRDVLLVGPTCFEDDAIGEWKTEDALAVGARVILRNVSGYAVAWNTGFHGVPTAAVIIAM